MTRRGANGRHAASTMARKIVEQFGFVTTALPDRRPLLRWQQVQVVRVHLGDDQRHIVGHAVRARVADDHVAGLGEGVLVSGGGGGIERREAAGARGRGPAPRRAGLARLGPAPIEQPGKVPVPPPCRPLAGGEPGQVEPRVRVEPPYELLPHHAGGPDTPTSHPRAAMTSASPAPGGGRNVAPKKPADGCLRRRVRVVCGVRWCCYGPDTAPPPMLVIRIAIIRIAAAGEEECRSAIRVAWYRAPGRLSSSLYLPYVHIMDFH